jgi:DNA primase
MEDYSLLVELLEEVLGKSKKHSHSSGQISFDCPVCSYDLKGLEHGDGKGNFEVNYTKNAFKCWACAETNGTHGNLYTIFKRWGNRTQLKKLDLLLPEEFTPAEKKYERVRIPKEFINLKDVSDGMRLTHHFRQADNYLKSRSITQEQINKYNIGYCYEGYYGGRIIIPSYTKEGDLNYFVARSYSKHEQKYKNPVAEKDKIFFNESLVDFSKDIYLVEGAFDSIFVPNSIPMLGKYLSEMLWRRIYNEAEANVYICLDGDAWRDAERLYYRLNGGRLHRRVKLIKLPKDKDIADLKGEINPEWIMELEY